MGYNPNASYRTVLDQDGNIFVSQGGVYYDKNGNIFTTLPTDKEGFAAPVDNNLVAAFTSGTSDGVTTTYPVTNQLPHIGSWPAFTSASGTDTTPTAGTRYYSSLFLPYSYTMTGIAFLIGSVGGTNNVIVELHDNAGVLLATSALAGTLVGTTGTMQQVPFTAPIAIKAPGIFYFVTQFNGNTCRFKTIPATVFGLANTVHTGSAAGTFGTSAAITPPPGFVDAVGPIVTTY